MTDLLSATQGAVYRAVSTGVTFGFFVNVPQGAKAPFGKVGTIEAEPEPEKGDGLERHEVELIYVYQGREKADLTAMMHAGRVAIEAAELMADGADFSQARWLSSVASDASAADGITYAGISRFEIYAMPA